MPVERAVDQKERWQRLAVHERVGHHDVDRGHVAVGDEPLLAVDHPAGLGAPSRGLDARRIGARLLLGDRVGVVQLAAQRRLEPALDLLGGPAGEHVVGTRHVPGQRVGRAAELLLHEKPLGLAPALAAVLGRVEPARQARLDRLALDALLELVAHVAAAALGQLLVGDQHLVDEAPRALLQVELLGREVRGGREAWSGGGDGHANPPGRPSFRLSWLMNYVEDDLSGLTGRRLCGQRGRLGHVCVPCTASAVRDESLHPRSLSRGVGPAQLRDRVGKLAFGLWGDGKPCVAGTRRAQAPGRPGAKRCSCARGHDIMRLTTKSGTLKWPQQ